MKPILFTSLVLTILVILSFSPRTYAQNDKIISYIADPKKQDLQLYWKDDKERIIQNFGNLKNYVARKNKKHTQFYQ